MTPEQDIAHRALSIGAPAHARIYAAICEQPGLYIREIKTKTGITHVQGRIARLEKAGLITTRYTTRGTPLTVRRCYPVEAP